MSDLCHNCGDCHLGTHPTPCPKPLFECTICKNFGHTFAFCPLSVTLVVKDYEYWMLCHNCDKWHLPRPCAIELVHCPKCHNVGHLPTFCPLNPSARGRPLGDSTAVGFPAGTALVRDIKQVHPDLIHQIQADAIWGMQPPAMSPSGNLGKFVAVAPQKSPSSSTYRQILPSMAATGHGYQRTKSSGSEMQSPSGNAHNYRHPNQYLSAEPMNFPTPVPSSATKRVHAFDLNADTSAVGIQVPFNGPHIGSPSTHHAPDSTGSPAQARLAMPEPATIKNGKRSRNVKSSCASCKKSKKRCQHKEDEVTDSTSTPTEVEDAEEPMPQVKKPKLSVGSKASLEHQEHTDNVTAEPVQESTRNAPAEQQLLSDLKRELEKAIHDPTLPRTIDISSSFQTAPVAAFPAFDMPVAPVYQTNAVAYHGHPTHHGSNGQYEWLQRSANSGHHSMGPTTTSSTDDLSNAANQVLNEHQTQALPSLQDVMDSGNPFNFNVDDSLAPMDQMTFSAEDNDAMQQTLDQMNSFTEANAAFNQMMPHDFSLQNRGGRQAFEDATSPMTEMPPHFSLQTGPSEQAFYTAQANSRQSGDVFSYGDNGRVDSYTERQPSMNVVETTESHTDQIPESPSGQIQYELPTPTTAASNVTLEAEATPAAKPKKKKGGRKKNW